MGKNRKSSGGTGDTGNEPTTSDEMFTDEQWENVHTAEEIAELTGWEFTKTQRGSYKFYDREHDLTLFIDKTMLTNGFINADSDGGNHLKSNYGSAQPQDLRDIARMVHELPDKNKEATPLILFRNNFKTRILGEHVHHSDFWDKIIPGHEVVINSSSFKSVIGHSLRRTLLHETYHAEDYMRGTGSKSYDSDAFGISNKQSFRNAIDLDVQNYGSKGISTNSGGYARGSVSYYKECWADAASVVQLKRMGYSNEKIKLRNGVLVTVDDWIKTYPNTYKSVSNELDNNAVLPFQRGEDYNIIRDSFANKYKLNK